MTIALPSTLEPEVLVSWDGSGAFDGDFDDVTSDALADNGIAVTHGRQDSLTLSPPRVSDGGFELNNESGAYSQERADSPVYQRVLPGRPVRYQARHGTRRRYRSHDIYRSHIPYRGRGLWPLGRHVIRDISQTTELGNRRVDLTTLGYETILTRAKVTIPVMVTPLVSECFTAYLDAVGWPTDKRDISVSDTRLLFYWADERVPWDGMLQLLASEGPGSFGVRRDGTFYFENRNYRTTTARSTTSRAIFYDEAAGARSRYRSHVLYRSHRPYGGRTSGLWFTGLDYDPGFKNIYNRATYATARRTLAGAPSVIWSYGTSFDLTSGQSRTLIAKPSDPFQNAITPVAATDYTATGAGSVSVTLSASSGLVAFITVTATGGSATVSGLQLRAQPLTVASETIASNSLDASASIAAFSPVPGENVPITLDVQGWPEIDVPNAEAVCNAWVSRYQLPRPIVAIRLRNGDAENLRQILDRTPSDRITLRDRHTGLDADVWVNSTEISISGAGGRVVEGVLGCEKVEELTGAVWDESLWDGLTATWGT